MIPVCIQFPPTLNAENLASSGEFIHVSGMDKSSLNVVWTDSFAFVNVFGKSFRCTAERE